MSNEYLTPFIVAQVFGFPIAFLIRGGVRLWRARRGDHDDRRRNRLEAAANACFAAMSIMFVFSRIAGIFLLAAGVWMTIAARRPSATLVERVPLSPPSPSIRRSKLSRKRKPARRLPSTAT